MKSLSLSAESFASARRKIQDEYAERLMPALVAYFDGGRESGLAELLRDLWLEAYASETDGPANQAAWESFIEVVRASLAKAGDQPHFEAIALSLANATVNSATMAAADADEADLLLEWVTMEDPNVRPLHRDAEGQQRPPGEPFTVGEFEVPYPGAPVGPPEVWINCRCVVRPTLIEDDFATRAAAYDAQQTENLEAAMDPEDQPTDTEVQSLNPLDLIPTGEAVGPTPWHGILVVEGIETGDGRRFEEGSLRFGDLPMALTWQKVSDDGHKANVTVAKIEKIERIGAEIHASGHFINSPEAEECIGLVGEFGRFGVSIDADDGTREYLLADEETGREIENYLDARIRAACIVHIPAYMEAWVALGMHATLDADETEDVVPAEVNPEADEDVPVDVAAADDTISLKRGPGWVTNPEATKRLHSYWTRPGEEGYDLIGWGANGSNGDFARCVSLVGAKIAENSPEDLKYINRICAEWHHDALGIWPGESLSAEERLEASAKFEGEAADTISLTAGGRPMYNAEWFANPNLTEATPITITDDGRVFGHIAEWETCHIGFDRCTVAPSSEVDYAFFLRGTVMTENGEQSVGPLTIVEDTSKMGHAGARARGLEAAAHYDNVGSTWAYVNAGEDEFGIWFAGQTRHGVDPAQVELARSVGAVSGDWRKMGGSTKELVAVLTVNTPGFSLWRPRVGFVDGEDVSLVAAGMVQRKTEADDPVRVLASALADEMESRAAKRQIKAKADSLRTTLTQKKADSLRARLGSKERV